MIKTDGIYFKDAFEKLYSGYALGKKSLSETLRQSPIHGNPAFPAPDTVDTRYINEDLPFGLAAWSAIGKQYQAPTPTIDAVIQIAATMTGKDYLQTGLSTTDLGIAGLSAAQLQAIL